MAGLLLVVGIGAGWFAYGTWTARADASAPLTPAEARQQKILKQNLGRAGDAELGRLYAEINAKHFSGALPALAVRWEPALADVGALSDPPFTLEGMFGRVGTRTVILLNPAVQATPGSLERALCHEMVHAYLYTQGDLTTTHGARFKEVLRRLAEAGAFEGIPATDEEKTDLKAWLDAESSRIEAEKTDVDAAAADLARDRAAVDAAASDEQRAAYNQRVTEFNERIARDRDQVDHFNREVARYNLMISYPDGFDETPVAQSKPLTKSAGGR